MDPVKFKKLMKNIDLLLLYFSASWCEKCQTFTPKLKKVYEAARRLKWGLEILLVPLDENMDEMQKHYQTQSEWHVIGMDNLISKELVYTFNVTYIPAVVVLTNQGRVITRTGMQEIEKLDVNVLVTWTTE